MTTIGLQAVTTTGIYCRADCVARPHPEHVRSYPSTVAAEAAGYRPCLRCRPDRLPERSADVPAAVAHALVLISDGHLDSANETDLAARVGYSGRQLRRLFQDHVGATPDFVARSRRAHFARRLLDETELSIGDVAFASGFASVRQMNRVVKDVFGFAPTALRERRRQGDLLATDGGLALRVPHQGDLPVAAITGYLASRAIPGVEAVGDGRYRRTILTCGHPGVVDIGSAGDPGHLEVVAHLPTFAGIIDEVGRVRSLFATDEDPAAGVAHFDSDPVLGPMVADRPGLRLPGAWDRFETVLRIVLGQQVSVAAASTVAGRLAQRCGSRIDIGEAELHTVFPGAEAVAEADLSGLGLTTRREATVRRMAQAVAGGEIQLSRRGDPGDLDEIIDEWCALPGVGPWTAHLVAARVHRHGDAFPASDLGLRRAAGRALGHDVTTDELSALAERWRPHRALAAAHLWFSEHRREDT